MRSSIAAGRQDGDVELFLTAADQVEVLSDGAIGDVECVPGLLPVLHGERIEHLFEGAAAHDFDFGGLRGLGHVVLGGKERERAGEDGQTFHLSSLTA